MQVEGGSDGGVMDQGNKKEVRVITTSVTLIYLLVCHGLFLLQHLSVSLSLVLSQGFERSQKGETGEDKRPSDILL